jgi:cysteinyl-tRNA synthetase
LKAKTNAATKRAAIADFDRVLALDLLAYADKLAEEQRKAKEAASVRVYSTDPEIRAIEEAIDARTAAKKAKNYAEADRIRAELLEKGIVLTDTSAGTTWQRA